MKTPKLSPKQRLGEILMGVALCLGFFFSLFTSSTHIPNWAWRSLVGLIFIPGLMLRWEKYFAIKMLSGILTGGAFLLGGLSLFSDLSRKPLWWGCIVAVFLLGLFIKRYDRT